MITCLHFGDQGLVFEEERRRQEDAERAAAEEEEEAKVAGAGGAGKVERQEAAEGDYFFLHIFCLWFT